MCSMMRNDEIQLVNLFLSSYSRHSLDIKLSEKIKS